MEDIPRKHYFYTLLLVEAYFPELKETVNEASYRRI